MKLYYSPGASSLAVHIVLLETGRRFDLDRVDLKTHRTANNGDFRAINPKGDVPVLELGTERLTEVSVILQYLADLAPASRLAPPAGTFARYRLLEWLSFLATEVEGPFRLLARRDLPESYAAKVRGRIAERFYYLQNELSDHGNVMDESFTIADAYLFTLLRWTDQHGMDLLQWPNLADYEERVLQRPSVLEALDAEGLPLRHRFPRSA